VEDTANQNADDPIYVKQYVYMYVPVPVYIILYKNIKGTEGNTPLVNYTGNSGYL
jgi:hypothetical protein